jgi:hypothetical protein
MTRSPNVDTPPTPPAPRDANGKFATGNPGGPGRPRGRRVGELRIAAEDAVTPEVIRAVMKKVSLQALQGNLMAARILFERTLGRAADAPIGEPLEIQAPRLRTAADCAAALQRVSDALCAGTIDVATAKVLTDVIQTQAKLIEVGELEARLAELEQQARNVDFGGQR